MGLDRRDFFKTLGVVGATLAVGKGFAAEKKAASGTTEFYGMLYDPINCLGCHACERLCAKAHDLPEPEKAPEAGIIRNTDEKHRTVVNCFKTSKDEVYVKKQCMHCNEPACAAACLTQAMYKTKEGPVIWRGDKCMGCRYCMVSCPYDIPKFEYHSANPKIQKCDMCYERVVKGEMPVCAEGCPGDAIMFGTRRELITEARKRIAENPKDYTDVVYGEHDAGGTCFIYMTPVPVKEMGFNPKIQKESYPALSKGFLYSVPSVFVLLPPLLLGIHEATKNNHKEGEENE
jgi:Fe-S-cluster-containing dehydrogenase component